MGMKKMRIGFILAIVAIVCCSGTAIAGEHKSGKNMECFYDSKVASRGWDYYFCGNTNSIIPDNKKKCDGKEYRKWDNPEPRLHGEKFTFRTAPYDTYFCCDGTTTKAGKFVSARGYDTFIIKTETKVKNLTGQYAGYQCTQQINTNICGQTETIDCDVPDTCNGNGYMRNGACATPCPSGQVYESPLSNQCIACESKPYQGIVTDPKTQQASCLRCNQDTELFDSESQTCKRKTEYKKISAESLKKCWRCPLSMQKDCVYAVEDNTIDKLKGEIKSQCGLI